MNRFNTDRSGENDMDGKFKWICIGTIAVLLMLAGGCGSSSDDAVESADDGGAQSDGAESDNTESDNSESDDTGTDTTAEPEASDDPVEISILVPNAPPNILAAETMIGRYTELNPHVMFDMELYPPGEEGDNLVKTRLATGEMNDIFYYNSGSLLQALDAERTIEPLTGDTALDTVSDGFLPAVSSGDDIYGVPAEPGMAGGILYNKEVYADLGLEVPITWDEFVENNEAIKDAGIVPVLATYADAWTAQLFILADFYNVQAQEPGFADAYTANEAKYATSPAASTSFARLAEGVERDWYQDDFLSTSFSDGLGMLARGEVAHYPMLTAPVPTIEAENPGAGERIGYFAQPSDDPDINGATLWLPNAFYIAKGSDVTEAAKEFLRWVTSVEGAEFMMSEIPPTGPIVLEGVTLPDTVLPVVKDVQAYVDSGRFAPALEFVSPVKGPGLPQISVEVGSGIRSAEDGASTYDDDVAKQAQQLGLEGW